MKQKIGLFLIILVGITFPLFGMEFLYKTDDGTHYYRCNHCCEKVKVFTQRGGYYRVYTTYFGRMIKAGSPYEAAEIACVAYEKRKDNSVKKEEE